MVRRIEHTALRSTIWIETEQGDDVEADEVVDALGEAVEADCEWQTVADVVSIGG